MKEQEARLTLNEHYDNDDDDADIGGVRGSAFG